MAQQTKEGLFDISADGWIAQQRGRGPEELTREAIQNSLDAESDVLVSLDENKGSITVRDWNEDGVESLDELWTVFEGSKSADPTKRGRFGRGIKELIAGCDIVTITSTVGQVVFNVHERNRVINEDETLDEGTKVIAKNSDWSKDLLREVEDFVKSIWVPPGIEIEISTSWSGSETLTRDEPAFQFSTSLDTPVLEDGVVNKTKRGTTVYCKKTSDNGIIYEMGIPIYTSWEVPYELDIQQKVPMAEQRNEVDSSFQEKLVYTFINNCHEHFMKWHWSSSWVTENITSIWIDNSVQEEFVEQVYGDNYVLSSNEYADDLAEQRGYEVINEYAVSRDMRRMLNNHISTAQDIADSHNRKSREIVDPSPEQQEVLDYIYEEIAEPLGYTEVNFKMAKIADISVQAETYSDGEVILLNTVARDWDKIDAENIGTVIHEIAHLEQEGHDNAWWTVMQNLAGELIIKNT